MAERAPRRHRRLFWSTVLLALAALVGGGGFAYVTYAATAGPDGAVKGYFAALAKGDAPAALGFGDLPPGPTTLLTSTVLRVQQKIAPLRQVEIVSTDRSGDAATVRVRYQLDFGDGPQQVSEDVRVLRRTGSWRLARTAASTQLRVQEAADRATILGAKIPVGALLVFPGAVPISFDTPYLRLAAATSSVALDSLGETDMTAQVTEGGRQAVHAAVLEALRGCLAGGAKVDPRCPLPTSRSVPGSLRATVSADGVRRAAVIGLAASPTGVITISGNLKLTGGYAALDFNNQPVVEHGAVTLPLAASAYAAAPITIDWAAGQ
jgi:hypothetical protein